MHHQQHDHHTTLCLFSIIFRKKTKCKGRKIYLYIYSLKQDVDKRGGCKKIKNSKIIYFPSFCIYFFKKKKILEKRTGVLYSFFFVSLHNLQNVRGLPIYNKIIYTHINASDVLNSILRQNITIICIYMLCWPYHSILMLQLPILHEILHMDGAFILLFPIYS